MNRLVYQVCLGPRRPLWDRCIASVRAYCQRHGFTHLLQTEPVLRIVPIKSARSANALRLGYLSVFEKWNAYPLLRDYDEIALLDADVYAHPNAASIFEAVPEGFDFAAAIETTMPVTPAYAQKLRSYAQAQYGDSLRPFMNLGVQVVRPSFLRCFEGREMREFIMQPRFAKYVNGEGAYRWQTEQTLTNDWLRDCGASVFPFPWQWNALYGALRSLEGAQLVHFFLSDHLTGDDPEKMLREGNARTRV